MSQSVYRQFLEKLHAADLAYVLLRDDVTRAKQMKDLDLLIAPAALAQFRILAESCGFHLVKDGVLNPGKWVFLKLDGQKAYVLDVHTRMVCRAVEFLDRDTLIARRETRAGFFVLSPEDQLLSLLFHNVLAKGCIQEKHYSALKHLLTQPLDAAYLRRHTKGFGLTAIFEEITENLEAFYRAPERVRELRKRARRNLLLRHPANCARVAWIACKKRLPFPGRKRGVLIAFLGPDGTGKSTLIKRARARLKELGLNVRVAYMGPWGGSLLHLKEKFAWLNPDPYREDYKAYYAGKLTQPPGPLHGAKKIKLVLRSALYYVLLMIEMWARWLVRVQPHLARGRIVLGDRYLYDMLVGYKNRPMDYQTGIRRYLCDHFKAPDIGVLLDGKKEAVLARKSQLSSNHFDDIRARYHEIARDYGLLTLDISVSVEATMAEFEKKILPEILQRLSAKLH